MSIKLPKKLLGILIITFITLMTSTLNAQFTYSAGVGSGILFPDFKDFNATLTDSGLNNVNSLWIPISYNLSMKIYPSLKIGYQRFSTKLLPSRSSDKFSLWIVLQGISLQSFFTFWKRFEADFTMAPLLAKASFYQDEITAKTSPFQFSTKTRAGADNRFFAYYSSVGLRIYFTTFLALEGNLSYLKTWFRKNNWKNEGRKVNFNPDIKMTQPYYGFQVIVGW